MNAARGMTITMLALLLTLATSAITVPASTARDPVMCAGQEATLVGTPGDDVLLADHRDEVIQGRGGNDAIRVALDFGYGYGLIFCGGKGADRLTAGPFGGTLIGGPGDDVLIGRWGGGTYVPGPGDDSVTELAVAWGCVGFPGALHGVRVDLKAGTALGEGTDRLRGITCIRGTPFGDVIRGNNDPAYNVLVGGGGHDVLEGRKGYDQLRAGPGDDILRGGPTAPIGVFVKGQLLIGGTGNDELHGGTGRDELVGGGGRDVLTGSGGDDHLEGGHGNDRLTGGPGYDHANGGPDHDVCRAEQVQACE